MPHRSLHPRAAFTIAECLVAVTLFAVGLLGLSGTQLAVERLSELGARRADAAAIAWARFEQLRGTPCAARSGGSARLRGIDERWNVMPAPGVSLATDSLTLPLARGRPVRGVAVATALPC